MKQCRLSMPKYIQIKLNNVSKFISNSLDRASHRGQDKSIGYRPIGKHEDIDAYLVKL